MRLAKTIRIVVLLLLLSLPVVATDFTKGIYYDLPQEYLSQKIGRIPVSTLTAADSAKIMSYSFEADTLRLVVVLVDWQNRRGSYSRETLDSMLFSRNVYPGGSVADFFYESSYGKLTMTGDVYDWYDAGFYQGWFDFESILPALDNFIDFSQYDANNDGDVDAVVFLRSGTGQEFTHDPLDIWSYAYTYPPGQGPGPFDGKTVSMWNTSPEMAQLRDSNFVTAVRGDTLNGIRVFCHELTHNLGMPDLYDYDEKINTATYSTPNDANDHPLVDWCLMGYGGYGILSLGGYGHNPTHHSGWIKKNLGWVEPIALNGTLSDVVLYNLETRSDSSLYILPINPAEGEYFLLEYRNHRSTAQFSKVDSDFSSFFWPDLTHGSDTLDRGLLITHIHDSVGGWRNNGWPGLPNYKVTVEDAGYNPSRNYLTNPEGRLTDSAQWWYPYETRRGALFSDDVDGQSEFGPLTYPSSDGYGGPSNIFVRVDSMVDDRLYLYIESPNIADGDGDGISDYTDNCPGVYNPSQDDLDTDGFGNECDNCSADYNPDQTDTDGDGIGNSCDSCPNDFDNDIDGDGICGDVDDCPNDQYNDQDSDGLCASNDNCPTVNNPDQIDSNNDNIGDACCCVLRGDNDLNGSHEISDLTFIVDYLFDGGESSGCPTHMDINGDIEVGISDLTFYVEYMFNFGDAPPNCQ